MAEVKDDTWKDSARGKENSEFGVELAGTSKEEVIVITQPSPKEEESAIPPVGGKTKEQERLGLTNAEAEEGYKTWGFNELPTIEIPLWWVFLKQFTGTMPYMMEVCIIVAGATQDWPDFGIIIAMLLINGSLGFHEELNAAAALAELTNKMEKKIATVRDGNAVQLLTRLLVPGDVVLLVGGCEVPADIEWVEGDVLSIDTAALTGEPLPRNYPSEEYGHLILCGSTVRAGEAYGIVRKTGTNTEIGGAQADIMKDKAHTNKSLFEERILFVVKTIILATCIDVFIIFWIQGIVSGQFYSGQTDQVFLTCLSIIIASIPIALPLVLQVTMALGAAKMAREFNCVVTSLPALQDISSMTVLCSDKTGTLTTARISINAEQVWTSGDFTKEDVALYAGLASNRDKKEDAIDRSVVGYVDRVFGGTDIAMAQEKQYTKTRSVGFNPIYKRVLLEYSHPTKGKVTVVKGLPNKILDTADGGEDDAADQWKCEGVDELKPIVKKIDFDFSKAGYKTLAIAVKIGDGPYKYVGILPMLDPPRHDTKQTISNLVNAGIEVKMITGDHLNIAKETARLVGLGLNIHAGSEIRGGDRTCDELIHDSNGFAQVLPRDKREVVLVLKEKYKYTVGMTGDGVNDAPALSAAQCGVAVDDATDAAKNAAAIILTSPGLSAIYMAVVESRRIFRKLKSYVIYRLAASIQIVVVLSLLIYISSCSINSLFIVLLALFNDITMLPIAYDIQVASKGPEDPNIKKLLIMAILLGCIEAGLSLFWAYGVPYITIFQGTYLLGTRASVNKGCDTQTQAIIWLNMFVASELLIFSTRAQSYMLFSVRPSYSLISGVFIGCLIICIIAGQSSTFGSLPAVDICYVWIWNIFWIFIIDIIKVEVIKLFQESTEVLADIEFAKGAEEAEVKPEGETPAAADGPVLVSVDPSGQLVQVKVDENTMNKRENAELARMASNIEITRKLTEGKLGTLVNTQSASNTALVTATRSPSSVVLVQRLGSVINAPRSASGGALTNNASSTSLGSVATINSVSTTSGTDMRGNSLIISGPLIPNTPASLAVIKKSRVRKA